MRLRNSAAAAISISIFTVFCLILPFFGYAALHEIGEKAVVAANPPGTRPARCSRRRSAATSPMRSWQA